MAAESALGSLGRFLRWLLLGGFAPDSGLGVPDLSTVELARRSMMFPVLVRIGVLLGLVALVVWARSEPWEAGAVATTFVLAAALWFRSRARARRLLLHAALRSIVESPPLGEADVSAFALLPARALQRLAVAVDLARRGQPEAALRFIEEIHEGHLEPDERRLLLGVRAIAAQRLGDRSRAATLARSAFPVGAPDFDERLGRIYAESAWHDATRLSRAYDEWRVVGYVPDPSNPVGRLLSLVDLKLHREEPPSSQAEAEILAEEARALGDRELAERALSVVRAKRRVDYR